MSFILLNKNLYEETHFDNEAELEKVVYDNKNFILGESTVLLDYK